MQEDILIQISSKIREARKGKNITVQQFADKAKVSKGLISQIENNRTIPSLPVLMSIVQSLEMDLTEFFKDIPSGNNEEKVLIKRAVEYHHFVKEPVKGFNYKRILSRTVNGNPVDIVLLELQKGAKRNHIVKTDAWEYKYIIRGKAEYQVEDEKYILEEGDSIFFDGRLGHKPANIGDAEALILVVYFFLTNNH